MESVLGEHVVDRIVVAPSAKFKALFLECKRVCGRSAFMALSTVFTHERLMCRIVYDPPAVRSVHVMAHGALAVLHRIVRMCLDKNRLVYIMATLAERRHLIIQQRCGLGRSMRIMAVDAAFLHRRVLELRLLDLLSLLFVAVVAQFIPLFTQIVLIIGSVRVMALDALAFKGNFVGAARVCRHDCGVAGHTELAHLR